MIGILIFIITLPFSVVGSEKLYSKAIQNLCDHSKTLGQICRSQAAKVIVFVSPLCPCSRSYLPHLRELHERFKDRFDFFALDVKRETASQSLPFVEIFDEHLQEANDLGALRTPHVFVLDTQGALVYRGAIGNRSLLSDMTKSYLELALAKISAGKRPDPEKTQPLGCDIER